MRLLVVSESRGPAFETACGITAARHRSQHHVRRVSWSQSRQLAAGQALQPIDRFQTFNDAAVAAGVSAGGPDVSAADECPPAGHAGDAADGAAVPGGACLTLQSADARRAARHGGCLQHPLQQLIVLGNATCVMQCNMCDARVDTRTRCKLKNGHAFRVRSGWRR